jgi:hypothetical protein
MSHEDVAAALRAGAAVYNAARERTGVDAEAAVRPAHDPFEAAWLDLPEGTPDERLLHGLVQFVAAVHHARRGNGEGATGLAASGRGYLRELDGHRGVNVEEVRVFLERLAAGDADSDGPPALAVDGTEPAPADLGADPEAALRAAGALADALDYDADPVERGTTYARSELPDGGRFLRLVLDFVADGAHRRTVHRRLADHVARRRRREADVEGLF